MMRLSWPGEPGMGLISNAGRISSRGDSPFQPTVLTGGSAAPAQIRWLASNRPRLRRKRFRKEFIAVQGQVIRGVGTARPQAFATTRHHEGDGPSPALPGAVRKI